ncbi:MAG TPA: 30S ribosomal protein S20 [Phycisphaeraceae bacterium]|nr:30S ribosomal protein S20 [Phycisphaeraceae bacterium]
MAHSLSAKKRIRQNEKNRARNRWRKATLREAVKAFSAAVAHGTIEEADAAFRNACSVLDKTAGKGVIHRNTAARKKSRLSAKLKARKQASSA